MSLSTTDAVAAGEPDEIPTDITTGSRREHVSNLIQRQGGVAVLGIVVIVASFATSGFATYPNISAMLVGSAYQSLLAVGMTFVIISGGIDLSVGSVFALGGVLGAWGATHGGLAVAVLLPLAVCGTIGLVQGLMVARARLAPFIVTLAGLLGARGLLQAITSDAKNTYIVPPHSAFAAIGDGTWAPIITAVVVFLLAGVLLQRTRYGQALFAIGGSEQAALLMGLPVTRTKTWVYVQSALIAGGAGMLNASRLQSGVTNIGVGYELTAIAAVVIGGTLLVGGAGSLWGTAAGVLLLAVTQNLIGHYVAQYGSAPSAAVNGGFLALVVLLQAYLSRAQRIS
jgi:ribose transport system permease protein